MSAKVILFMVSSINGHITNQHNPNIYRWTSKEDSKLFLEIIKRSKLIIMGSQTYLTNRSKIKLRPNQLRIVITRNPQRFKNDFIKGQLEFTSDSPKKIIRKYQNFYREIILVGGGQINALFLKSSLIDEIHLTIEPLIFGNGKNLVYNSEFTVKCQLEKIKKLNQSGSLHLIYKVLH